MTRQCVTGTHFWLKRWAWVNKKWQLFTQAKHFGYNIKYKSITKTSWLPPLTRLDFSLEYFPSCHYFRIFHRGSRVDGAMETVWSWRRAICSTINMLIIPLCILLSIFKLLLPFTKISSRCCLVSKPDRGSQDLEKQEKYFLTDIHYIFKSFIHI